MKKHVIFHEENIPFSKVMPQTDSSVVVYGSPLETVETLGVGMSFPMKMMGSLKLPSHVMRMLR